MWIRSTKKIKATLLKLMNTLPQENKKNRNIYQQQNDVLELVCNMQALNFCLEFDSFINFQMNVTALMRILGFD